MNKRYFKIKNHKLFGGDGIEVYISMYLNGTEDINKIAKKLIETNYGVKTNNIKCIEITKEEYLELTEEEN